MWAPNHRQTLIDYYTFLMEEMEAKGTLLDYLLQCEVLDEQELDEIRVLPVRHERNAKLLDFILRTTSAQYDMFLEALRESKQNHVYISLLRELLSCWYAFIKFHWQFVYLCKTCAKSL